MSVQRPPPYTGNMIRCLDSAALIVPLRNCMGTGLRGRNRLVKGRRRMRGDWQWGRRTARGKGGVGVWRKTADGC